MILRLFCFWCSHVAVRRNLFCSIQRWPRWVMLLGAFQDFIVRGRFPFEIVRRNVILAHRMIFEFVPHQNPPQIGMPVEMDAVEIEDFALLKFGAAPHRGERWQMRPIYAIRRPHSNNERTVFEFHRVEVINRLEISGNFLLAGLVDFFFNAVDDLFHLGRFLHRSIQPIDAGDIRAKIKTQGRMIAKKRCDCYGVVVVDQERRLLGRPGVNDDLDFRPARGQLRPVFDLLKRFHKA